MSTKTKKKETKAKKKMVWRVSAIGRGALRDHLNDGYEPFAATVGLNPYYDDGNTYETFYVRKLVEANEESGTCSGK